MAVNDVMEQLNNFDINDIDWSRMGVWPLAGKIVLCVLLISAIVAGGYFGFVKDLNMKLEKVTAEEKSLRKTFEKKAHEAGNLESYRAQMAEIEGSFGALLAQLPSDTEVPGLLEDIDERGAEAGLQINSIELRSEVAREFYVELPITIRVTGPYHDFGTFVSGVAGMPRIVTLHDYDMSSAPGQSGGILDMTILAKTYRYKSKE